jgi:alkylation response protein AidB-like acyl-CoA dehydrogenase
VPASAGCRTTKGEGWTERAEPLDAASPDRAGTVIDFDYDDVDAALADSVRGLCAARLARPPEGAAHGYSPEWWREVAELGVLGLATEVGGGSVTTVSATMEQLGRADAPGPFVETFVAMQLLGAGVGDDVAAGSRMATVATTQPVPWLPIADVVVEIDGGRGHLATVEGDVEALGSLAREPWGRAELRRVADLGDASRSVAVGDVAAGAYLVGEADHVLTEAAQYAADRVQFKVPIATFQAVSHPLADCFLELSAARALVRRAAYALDTGAPNALAAAATARRSATRAALDTVFRAHQTYGAIGFTVEGPIGNRSAKIRQVSLAVSAPGSTDRILSAWGC